MKTRQISVFIENEFGRLHEVMRLLGNNSINIRALSLADTSDFGIIRLIVNDPAKAYQILKDNEFTVGINDVIAISINDKPGGLADLLEILSNNKLNVEYMYAFVNNAGNNAVMIFRFEDTDKALKILENAGVMIMKESVLQNI